MTRCGAEARAFKRHRRRRSPRRPSRRTPHFRKEPVNRASRAQGDPVGVRHLAFTIRKCGGFRRCTWRNGCVGSRTSAKKMARAPAILLVAPDHDRQGRGQDLGASHWGRDGSPARRSQTLRPSRGASGWREKRRSCRIQRAVSRRLKQRPAEGHIAKVQEWLGHANIATTRIHDHRRDETGR